MNWAVRRRVIIISLIVGVVLLIASLTAVAVLYETPTCSDGKQNADETGIDCGGSCTYLCLAEVQTPVVRFARAFSPQPGHYDVIAYVDNRNPTLSARSVRVVVEIYDAGRVLLTTHEAVIDIPAGATVPVYMPEAYRGSATVGQVFLSFKPETLKFYTPVKKHVVPLVRGVDTVNSDRPRIRGVLENPTALPLYDIRPIATVFDAEGNVIAASQTLITMLGAQATTQATFTWTVPFPATPARVEILPVVPLLAP